MIAKISQRYRMTS